MPVALQVKGPSRPRWQTALLRILLVIAVTFAISTFLSRSARAVGMPGTEAGFQQGMLHGALMPCALPPLLLGHDVTIYAPTNSGRLYKLGYTVGVNACGAAFFGMFFWRLNRWRKALRRRAEPAAETV
jgi:hypothetical protein